MISELGYFVASVNIVGDGLQAILKKDSDTIIYKSDNKKHLYSVFVNGELICKKRIKENMLPHEFEGYIRDDIVENNIHSFFNAKQFTNNNVFIKVESTFSDTLGVNIGVIKNGLDIDIIKLLAISMDKNANFRGFIQKAIHLCKKRDNYKV